VGARVNGIAFLGVAFLGVGGAAVLALRWTRRPRARWRRGATLTVAGAEIASTAATSGLSEHVAGRVLEAHYAYLERHPRDRVPDVRVERAWIARESGLDQDTVRRVLEAHDEFLMASGRMAPLKAKRPV
jgi:transposase